jgi:hypothetical protein
MTVKVVLKPDEAPPGVGFIKSGGFAVCTFSSLDEARRIFPQLDADHQSKFFTAGFREKDCLRFESWAAYHDLST